MKRSRYEQDPDGDVDFVLRDPDGLRREWPEGYPPKRQKTEDALPSATSATSAPEPSQHQLQQHHHHHHYHTRYSNQSANPQANPSPPPPPHAAASLAPSEGDEDYDEDEDLQEHPPKRFRVSSRHLSLASPVFSQMLNGPWKEATSFAASTNASTSASAGPQRREIEASEWDTDATVILMDIIHGHFSQVPRTISLVMLAKVAILVDYYKCHEIVSVFSGPWIERLKREAASAAAGSDRGSGIGIGIGGGSSIAAGSYIGSGGISGGGVVAGLLPSQSTGSRGSSGIWQDDCFLWLFVSWVFGDDRLFSAMADTFLRKSPLPVSSSAFPLPEGMLTALDSARDEAIDQVLASIDKLRNDLCDGRGNCPYGLQYECSSMVLGSLIKGLRSLGLSPPARSVDGGHPVGCSLLGMQASFARLKRPVWYNMVASSVSNRGVVAHQCNLRSRLDALVRGVLEGLPKFQLEDFATSALRAPSQEGGLAVDGKSDGGGAQ
ncbi:uncharacterized protein B0I36DRAFT_350390 [Microdochium trichocladiopsis]|uniref:BTB domain-containing protein n=1 Tax=Microdochium trichocladiopsis TaxID=1682393 RepID=A0A9P8Y6Z7_9PEZI|nr:uncharacterized protein B0I36DRAFT_350390 [Microdochium trichocladiopsis]KAH7029533.1 hypothetical protein B0I36DRAFT_350390 [Microdochium trichocladiopsis]